MSGCTATLSALGLGPRTAASRPDRDPGGGAHRSRRASHAAHMRDRSRRLRPPVAPHRLRATEAAEHGALTHQDRDPPVRSLSGPAVRPTAVTATAVLGAEPAVDVLLRARAKRAAARPECPALTRELPAGRRPRPGQDRCEWPPTLPELRPLHVTHTRHEAGSHSRRRPRLFLTGTADFNPPASHHSRT